MMKMAYTLYVFHLDVVELRIGLALFIYHHCILLRGDNMRFEDRKGINLISSGYSGQWKYLRTTDTSNLEPVPMPFNRFQIWLGRLLTQLGL